MQPFTRIPNFIFDDLLASLGDAELKVLLVVIRQTWGWVTTNGKRKQRDRITNGQFQQKTGLAKRTVTKSIQRLLYKKLLVVTDATGKLLIHPKERRGKFYLFYALSQPEHFPTPTNAQKVSEPVHKGDHNKSK